jgi:hypothetical protein
MMKKLTDVFKGKTEAEKNMEELQVVESRIAEVQAHLNDLSAICQGIELELKLGADSALEKRFKKLTVAGEKAQQDLQEFEARKNELAQAINEEQKLQRKAQVEEAKREFEQDVFYSHRVIVVKQEMEKLLLSYDSVGGIVEPTALKALGGLRYGENFDATNPAHADIIEAFEDASKSGKERAEKDARKVIQLLNDFIKR